MSEIYFKPFIGNEYKYQEHKILLLGESHYDDNSYPNENEDKTQKVIERFLSGELNYRFLNNLLQAVCGKDFAKKDIQKFMFYNYVQEFLGGVRKRPTKVQWEGAKVPFMNLLEIHQPDTVICCGKGLYSNLPSSPIYCAEEVLISTDKYSWCCKYTYFVNDKEIRLFAIHHPSSVGFNALKYHNILHGVL